jgi:hypothetical protein
LQELDSKKYRRRFIGHASFLWFYAAAKRHKLEIIATCAIGNKAIPDPHCQLA